MESLINSEPLSSDNCSYYSTIRNFGDGHIEILTKALRPMAFMAYHERWMDGFVKGVPLPKTELTEEERADKDAENLRRSVRRGRQQIRYRVKTIRADHLLTLTYRKNMTDVVRLQADWQKFVRKVRARYPEWQFVAVPEKQERGALHLHVAVCGRQNIKYLRACWYNALGALASAKKEEAPGAVNIRGPKRRYFDDQKTNVVWKQDNLSSYLVKYLDKTFDESLSGAKRYWSSRGIAVPAPVKVWVAASSMADAIAHTVKEAEWHGAGAINLWLSEDGSAFWLSGRPDPAGKLVSFLD